MVKKTQKGNKRYPKQNIKIVNNYKKLYFLRISKVLIYSRLHYTKNLQKGKLIFKWNSKQGVRIVLQSITY